MPRLDAVEGLFFGGAGRQGRSLRGPAVCLVLVAVAAWMLATAGPALALDLGISPARIEQEVEPGEVQEGQIELGTHGDDPVEVRLYLMDMVVSANGSFDYVEPAHTQYSAATWVRLSQDCVIVKPDVPLRIDYEIAVPEDAESGGHYAMVFAEVTDEQGEGVTIAGRVGLQLLLTVPGVVTQHLAVGDISAPSIMLGLGGDRATVEVVNDGNVHAIPGGYLQWAGGTPAVDDYVELERVTMLPGSTHTYEVPLQGLPWIGRVKLKSEIKYGQTATEFTTGEAREVEVFVISWKILAILGLMVVGVPVSLFWDRMNRRRRAKRQRMTSDLDRRVDRFKHGRRSRPKVSEPQTEAQVSCVGSACTGSACVGLEDRTLEMNAAEFQPTYRRMDRYKNRRRTPALQE